MGQQITCLITATGAAGKAAMVDTKTNSDSRPT